MADLILTAMVAPASDKTYVTLDGTQYRANPDKTVWVLPQHVTELTNNQGFTTATAAQVVPGSPLSLDMGWSVSS